MVTSATGTRNMKRVHVLKLTRTWTPDRRAVGRVTRTSSLTATWSLLLLDLQGFAWKEVRLSILLRQTLGLDKLKWGSGGYIKRKPCINCSQAENVLKEQINNNSNKVDTNFLNHFQPQLLGHIHNSKEGINLLLANIPSLANCFSPSLKSIFDTHAVVVLEVAGDAVGLFRLGRFEIAYVVEVSLARLAGGRTREVPDNKVYQLLRVKVARTRYLFCFIMEL